MSLNQTKLQTIWTLYFKYFGKSMLSVLKISNKYWNTKILVLKSLTILDPSSYSYFLL